MNWVKILQLAATFAAISEDGKITQSEEDIIAKMIAPELAKIYKKELGPVEEWSMVKLLVKIAQETIKEINKNAGN